MRHTIHLVMQYAASFLLLSLLSSCVSAPVAVSSGTASGIALAETSEAKGEIDHKGVNHLYYPTQPPVKLYFYGHPNYIRLEDYNTVEAIENYELKLPPLNYDHIKILYRKHDEES